MKLALIFCLFRLSLSLTVLTELAEQPLESLEQSQTPLEYYEGEEQYQQVYQQSNPGTSSYAEGGEVVSDYQEYQQYIQPVADDQTTVYASDGQYEQQYVPYENYPDYGETPALQYLEDEGRYQTNYHSYADYPAQPVIESRMDTAAPVQTSRLQGWINQISEMFQQFLHRLEEKSRSSQPDRLWTMFTVTSLIIGSILSL